NLFELELRFAIILTRIINRPYDVPYRARCAKGPLCIEGDTTLPVIGQVPHTPDKTLGRGFFKNGLYAIGGGKIFFIYRIQYPLTFNPFAPGSSGGRAIYRTLLGCT